MQRFVCPNCGEKVEFYTDVTNTEFRSINSTTGKVSKKRSSSKGVGLTGAQGIKCRVCTWVQSLTDGSLEEGTIWDELELP